MASHGYAHYSRPSHPHPSSARNRRGTRLHPHRHNSSNNTNKNNTTTTTTNHNNPINNPITNHNNTHSNHTHTTNNIASSEYMHRLEAAKSFEWDDDERFCPFHLLTEEDLQSLHSSAASDHSSLSSLSPDASPLPHHVHPAASFLLPTAASASSTFALPTSSTPVNFSPPHMRLRPRNPIPIVDPGTRTLATPPLALSPARQPHAIPRRW